LLVLCCNVVLRFFLGAVLLLSACYEPIRPPDGGGVADASPDGSPDAAPVDTSVPPTRYTDGVGYPFGEDPLVLDDSHVTSVDPTTIPDRVSSPCMEPVMVTVTRIIDGDTVFVNGTGIADRVRMIGVNAPEIEHPSMPAECYGDEATAFTAALQSRQVWLTFDVECRDDFDRLLAYIWVGNGPQDLWSRQLVRRGYARAFPFEPNTSFADLITMDQAAASAADAGLWGACP
jgi:micrococcal nuclease